MANSRERSDTSKPQEAEPKPVGTPVQVPPIDIGLKAHLWLHWARIAIRQERRAWAARERGAAEREFAAYIGLETEEAIEAVAAARHCIHNLWRVWRNFLGINAEKQIELGGFTTGTPADPEGWSRRVLELIGDRDAAVHYDEESAPPREHPGYPTNVSDVAAVFTADRATQAVSVMLDDVLRLSLTAPSAALRAFSDDYRHVLGALEGQRAGGDDLW